MARAITALTERGVEFERLTLHQLKLGAMNYYPDTGRITVDGGGKAGPARGLDALLALFDRP